MTCMCLCDYFLVSCHHHGIVGNQQRLQGSDYTCPRNSPAHSVKFEKGLRMVSIFSSNAQQVSKEVYFLKY